MIHSDSGKSKDFLRFQIMLVALYTHPLESAYLVIGKCNHIRKSAYPGRAIANASLHKQWSLPRRTRLLVQSSAFRADMALVCCAKSSTSESCECGGHVSPLSPIADLMMTQCDE